MAIYKKNTAGQFIYFVMCGTVSSGQAGTGLTVTAKRSIDGGAIADCTGTIVEDGLGMYHLVASAADLNGNNIGFVFHPPNGNFPAVVNVVTAGATGIWDEPTANHTTTGSTGKAVADAAGGIVPNTIAASIWNYLTSAMATAGSIGVFLKTQLDTNVASRLSEADYTGAANGDIAAIKAKTDNLPGSPAATSDIPAVSAIADGLLDRTAGVETNFTVRQALRVILAALAGKVSGGGTASVVIRDTNDSKDRISATVDVDGNRTAVSYDKS
jgi:hypothetical protein